ncbi:S-adenosyl-L-methionine dependent methyltransferase [Gonapodya prolifera JEL478]|uniref:S-adenosyl-L-methionine dependent methyltransferase n=1 Tax=Gonapodya prolifera (strain JEL478) TaxID=1344416 RepID=A0A139ALU8_GONPJ|nr:S-adenosyl-L-methionine dependent methyltransferase [Gonapodya prolifera JEL478]|eukprot:KXS17757.1 S-adenosyl-L-methionine dependent methyltransferase [Gonapodya prolifera JEL478]
MHPFNPFRNDPPDFAQVARRFPSLRPYLTFSKSDPSYAQIDFHDPRAARELCYALMATKFNITLEIPLDSLIPPIPNRIDYLLWCLDLSKESEIASSQNEIWAIDVGTGCSCIYPLLGSRLDPRLRFVAIEVDERSAEYAQSNVEKNGLGGVIEVILNRDGPQYSTDILFPAAGIPYYSFAMCNPPFFRHPTDRLIKATLPSSTHSGSLTETVVPGGEVAFVKRMFEESRDLKDRVRWWTSLLGKKEDLETLKSVLRSEEVEVRTGRMRQGRTVRWSIGWSWKVGTT